MQKNVYKPPMASKIKLPSAPYVPAVATDIKETFKRIARERREQEKANPGARVL